MSSVIIYMPFVLGLFARSLIGMDRGTAKEAMVSYLVGKSLTVNQVEFINLIVNHLTEHGAVEPGSVV